MNLYILGIAGTFMGSLALLCKDSGFNVSGCDNAFYPPMSDLLKTSDITIEEGFTTDKIKKDIDLYIIGNAITRGNPMFEEILEKKLPYISGPQFLYEQILKNKKVIAISGTHGKTTTTSQVIKILTDADLSFGFLVGGVLPEIGTSAKLGTGDYFVIEADEYDTALFDKRSKFIHYHPDILIINNIEFDHADIFDNINDILRSFFHLIRCMPTSATIIINSEDENIKKLLQMGLYSKLIKFGQNKDDDFSLKKTTPDYSNFIVIHNNKEYELKWELLGQHNAKNALAAMSACFVAGISIKDCIISLSSFVPPKRRLEKIFTKQNLAIYDDFAHHPTAILQTLQAMSANSCAKIVAIVDPASNTMKMGMHKKTLVTALKQAKEVIFYKRDDLKFDITKTASLCQNKTIICDDITDIITKIKNYITTKESINIVIFSNSSFDGIYKRIKNEL
jgi:UDP-N-acetylmuramate: L-alanyl-gamma-D-glutamyl-meso-diaminopimelate ligase